MKYSIVLMKNTANISFNKNKKKQNYFYATWLLWLFFT